MPRLRTPQDLGEEEDGAKVDGVAGTEADDCQGDEGEGGAGSGEGKAHADVGQHVGQDVAEDDLPVGQVGDLGEFDVGPLSQG